jgi:hypothetical protein
MLTDDERRRIYEEEKERLKAQEELKLEERTRIEAQEELARRARGRGMSIWSLVLGILAIPLTILTGIPAVILGHIAVGQRRPGRGMAIAGLVLGWINIALFVLSMLGLLAGLIMLPLANR